MSEFRTWFGVLQEKRSGGIAQLKLETRFDRCRLYFYPLRAKSFVGDSDGFLRSHASLDFSRYCLSYLFTNHEIAGDTLGVAYVNGTCEKYQRVKDLVRLDLR